jgi:transcriptional regulator with XRE-family HTH domain
MSHDRKTKLIARCKKVGLRQREIAAILGVSSNVVTQRLNGYLPLSSGDEKLLCKVLKLAEFTRKKLSRKDKPK